MISATAKKDGGDFSVDPTSAASAEEQLAAKETGETLAFVEMYSYLAQPFHLIFYFLTVVCMVSILDRWVFCYAYSYSSICRFDMGTFP